MITCDWCEKLFATEQLWNVEYTFGYGNVLCTLCVVESRSLFKDDFECAWR